MSKRNNNKPLDKLDEYIKKRCKKDPEFKKGFEQESERLDKEVVITTLVTQIYIIAIKKDVQQRAISIMEKKVRKQTEESRKHAYDFFRKG